VLAAALARAVRRGSRHPVAGIDTLGSDTFLGHNPQGDARQKTHPMAHYQVLACEVLFREICYEAAQSPNIIDLQLNRFGLHDIGTEKMLSQLQEQIDSVQGKGLDAVLIGYGLCNNGTAGLTARDVPVVMPRAHDCITLLLGSKEKYQSEFEREPGTYYKSSGWLEHHNPADVDEGHVMKGLGFGMSYEEMVEKYGEDNAKYLQETMGGLGSYRENYTRMVYIDTGLGPREELIEETRRQAEQNGWRLEVMEGSRSLVKRMLWGEWDESDFLVIPPGLTVKACHNGGIVTAGP